jgi:hypothetical protein
MDLTGNSKGVYVVQVVDGDGNIVGVKRVVVR